MKFASQAAALLISRLAYSPRFIEHIGFIGYSTLCDIPAHFTVVPDGCAVQLQDTGPFRAGSQLFGLRII